MHLGCKILLMVYHRRPWGFGLSRFPRRGFKTQLWGGGKAARARKMFGRTGRARVLRRQRGYVRTTGLYRFAPSRFAQRGGELKFFDVDLDTNAILAAGAVTDSVNKIAQGTSEVQRIGRKCTIRSINWRWRIRKDAATASSSTGDTVRVILFLDKQANGQTATVTNLLESANYQSFNNLANKSRFRTLMDRTYDMNNMAGGGDGTTEDYGEVHINDSLYKKVNIPIEFDSTAGAIGEIRSNNIGVLLISESQICAFDSKFRLRFSDN